MKKTFIAFGFIILLFACTHKPFVPIVVTPPADTTHHTLPTDTTNTDTTAVITVDTSVCFQRDVLPIFIASCTQSGCHNASSKQDGYNLTSYNTIIAKGLVKGNSASSKLYTECTSGKMPKSPVAKLDSMQLSYIKRWIDKGAPNDTNCQLICDTTKFTFATAIAPILKTYCYGCHSTAAAASSGGSIVLDTYTGVAAQAANGKLIGDINHTSGFNFMPLGGNKLAACQITQIRKWIDAGMQNN